MMIKGQELPLPTHLTISKLDHDDDQDHDDDDEDDDDDDDDDGQR